MEGARTILSRESFLHQNHTNILIREKEGSVGRRGRGMGGLDFFFQGNNFEGSLLPKITHILLYITFWALLST